MSRTIRTGAPSLVAALLQRDVLEPERLLVERRRRAGPLPLPRGDVGELGVVAGRLAVRRLVLDAEVAPRGLVAVERVEADELGQLEVVRDAPRLLELLVQLLEIGRASCRERV